MTNTMGTSLAAPPAPPAPTVPTAPLGSPAPASASGSPVPAGGLRTLVRETFAGTPGRLRLLTTVVIIGSLLFAVLGTVGLARRSNALSNARADSTQLVRLQSIRTNLVQADAAATNAFLVGGLEPAATRAEFTDRLDQVAATITEASGHNAADAAKLGPVNRNLATYAGLIESARANNRQGFPLGGAYLRQASALLRDQILPALTDVAVTNQNRVRSSYNSDSRVTLLWVGGLLALAALLISQFWLASRMRRWFNLPLLIATAIVAGLLAIGGVATWYAGGKADDVRAGPYRAAVALTAARSDAFDAKSAESLTLINRGSGEVYETRFQAVVVDAESKLQVAVDAGAANGAQRDLTTYLNVHDQVRKLDNGGQWDDAVKLATGTAAQGSNNRFAIFAASSGKALTDQINHVNDDLSSARRPLVVLQWVVLLGGLVAAVAAWRGLAVRLQEYR